VTTRRRKQPPGKRPKGPSPHHRPDAGVDLWRPVPELAEPDPIVLVTDPTALLRSLGDPPLQGQGAVAEHYLAAVVERAAGIAAALAASADLLADPDDDLE
jgi:hypothetical protein